MSTEPTLADVLAAIAAIGDKFDRALASQPVPKPDPKHLTLAQAVAAAKAKTVFDDGTFVVSIDVVGDTVTIGRAMMGGNSTETWTEPLAS